MGQSCLHAIGCQLFAWTGSHSTWLSQNLASVLGKNQALFEEGLGTLKGYEANSIVQPGAQPRFYTSVKPAQPRILCAAR